MYVWISNNREEDTDFTKYISEQKSFFHYLMKEPISGYILENGDKTDY